MGPVIRLWMVLRDHPELEDRLGRESDQDLAEAYGVSVSTIGTWRRQSGYPNSKAPPPCKSAPRSCPRPRSSCKKPSGPTSLLEIHPGLVDRLGREPDRKLAEVYGVSVNTIGRWRRKITPRHLRKSTPGRRSLLEIHPKLAELEDRLGREPDRELAEAYGVSITTIKNWRRKIGYLKAPRSPTRKAPRAHPELANRLGREPDRELAEVYKVSISTIKTWRRQAGHPTAPRSPTRCGSPELDERLGTMPDPVLAAERGVSRQAIALQRKRRGIPHYRFEERLTGVLDQLGRAPDYEIARSAGTCKEVVAKARRARGISPAPRLRRSVPRGVPYEDLLGTMLDTEIAVLHGITASAVGKTRERRGIPSVAPRYGVPYESLLGTIPDAEIARLHGITRLAVFKARMRRGIPPAPRQKAK